MNIILQSILMWTGFGLVHTVFADNRIKEKSRLSPRTYRISYNLVASISFIVILILMPSIIPLYFQFLDATGITLLLFIIGIFIGGIVTVGGLIEWDLKALTGLSDEDSKLQTSGLYAFSRHPVYSGIMLILISLFSLEVSQTTFAWAIGISGYFIIGSFPEEKKLVETLNGYENYKAKVGRFFPYRIQHFRYLKNNLSSQ